MADVAAGGGNTGGGSPLSKSNLVSGGVGLVIGSATTLIVNMITNLGIRQLLADNPFVGLAVFAMLAALVLLVLGVATRSKDRPLSPVLLAGSGLVAVALVFAGFSIIVASQKLEILLRAIPSMKDVPTIQVVGTSLAPLEWNKELGLTVGRREAINLNVQPVLTYYADELVKAQSNCMQVIRDSPARQQLGVGSTQTGY